MKRIKPDEKLRRRPCLVTALTCACGKPKGTALIKSDGYATLGSANRWIRENVKVERRINFRRGERPKLKDLHLDGRAVVCVLGHYLFLDHETYWSFFRNSDDEVVTVWVLEEV